MSISTTANRVALVVMISLLFTGATFAEEHSPGSAFLSTQGDETVNSTNEATYVVWSLNIDNDLYIGAGRNRDYRLGRFFNQPLFVKIQPFSTLRCVNIIDAILLG